MNTLYTFVQHSNNIFTNHTPTLLPLLARIVFAITLLPFFWRSAHTKFADGFPFPSDGAYIQIFPRAFEAAGYDSSNMESFTHVIVFLGSYSEYLLPLLVVLGLASRLSALAMIGFIVIMTITDVFGHGAELGGIIATNPQDSIMVQRIMWTFLLINIVGFGGGRISVDRLLCRFFSVLCLERKKQNFSKN